jgi:hypothetical protein
MYFIILIYFSFIPIVWCKKWIGSTFRSSESSGCSCWDEFIGNLYNPNLSRGITIVFPRHFQSNSFVRPSLLNPWLGIGWWQRLLIMGQTTSLAMLRVTPQSPLNTKIFQSSKSPLRKITVSCAPLSTDYRTRGILKTIESLCSCCFFLLRI